MSITSVTANLNTLGNPQIFKNPLGNEITVAKAATGVIITFTPIASYDATNTLSANTALSSTLATLGLNINFNSSTITIISNSLVSNILSTYTLSIRNVTNTQIATEVFSLEILSPDFVSTQESCKYCLIFNPTESSTTSNNPPIANRGLIEYIFVPAIGSEELKAKGDYTTNVEACWCGAATNLAIKSILTIRQIPNCGGASPIVFQSILPVTLVNITEYVPVASISADFSCCIVRNKSFSITPLSFTLNNLSPHNTCAHTYLHYDLLDQNGDPVILTELKTGTITTLTTSNVITGVGTSFITQLTVGSDIYSNTDIYIGTVASITSNTSAILKNNAAIAITAATFKSNKYYFTDPVISNVFSYIPVNYGTYTVNVILTNCCDVFTKQYSINVCKSYLVETGICNNPVIKNIGSLNYLKINLTTYDELVLVDSITQKELFVDSLVAPMSELSLGTLSDGFYLLTIQELNSTAAVISTETQILFYDCNIKSCEVALSQKVLCFDFNCNNDYDYSKIISERLKFDILKTEIYSYWNNVKYQQSLPDSWDIESHLQELSTYTKALTDIQSICSTCGLLDNNDCFKGITRSVKRSGCTTCNQ